MPLDLARSRARALGQMTLIAAIVATMLFFPTGIGLVLLARAFGIGFEAVVTFGSAVGMVLGMAVWWLFFFAGSLVYAACVFPWEDEVRQWPRKK